MNNPSTEQTTTSSRSMMSTRHKVDRRWVSARDLTRLTYTVSGHGPVDFILCDGIGCDGFAWAYLQPYLEEVGRVYHLHMRGHGESEEPRDIERIGIEDLADDWLKIMEIEPIGGQEGNTRPIIVIGHSMGVQVALELYLSAPERSWASLILICGTFEHTAGNLYDTPMIERVLPLLRRSAALGGARLEKVWRRLLSFPLTVHLARATEMDAELTRKRDIERYLKHLGRMKPTTFLAMLQTVSQHSCRARLDEVLVPTLVIGGEKDHFTPVRLSIELDHLLPDSELFVLPNGTHSAPIEQTIEINQMIRDFLYRRVFGEDK